MLIFIMMAQLLSVYVGEEKTNYSIIVGGNALLL